MKFLTCCLFFVTLLFFAACQSAEERIAQRAHEAGKTDTAATTSPDGRAVFRQYCVTCHGSDGKLGLNGAKDFSLSTLTVEERIHIITEGKKMMTPFKDLLTPEEIQAVARYTRHFNPVLNEPDTSSR